MLLRLETWLAFKKGLSSGKAATVLWQVTQQSAASLPRPCPGCPAISLTKALISSSANLRCSTLARTFYWGVCATLPSTAGARLPCEGCARGAGATPGLGNGRQPPSLAHKMLSPLCILCPAQCKGFHSAPWSSLARPWEEKEPAGSCGMPAALCRAREGGEGAAWPWRGK